MPSLRKIREQKDKIDIIHMHVRTYQNLILISFVSNNIPYVVMRARAVLQK